MGFHTDIPLGQYRFIAAAIALIAGIIAGYLVGQANKRILIAAGIPDAVEGTPFERTAQSLDTSTVALVARLSAWFIYGISVFIALHIANLLETRLFWIEITRFIPHVFVAVLILIVGFVVADKAELVVSEHLRSVKLPEAGFIPKAIKYTIIFIALLLALAQVGISTLALHILFGVYTFAIVFLGGLACWDLLRSSAAGVYLLLSEPYSIGDEVKLGTRRGVVQEMDVFVTHIESNGEEYIVPNQEVLQKGVTRIRD